ncbi:phage portal protein [Solemya velum gill symbiont]|uniref:phage portal protein n=1 Tax=Solemya velum gill symbiont TaxID=2340 RepID=UPI00099845C4|nr:phage portal protein [Solemya velum gill symbiont]OOZ12210.1 phage portal protein [Solemya velum gill symbiont]
MSNQMILGPDGLPLAADTAHRGASLSARELSSWRPMAGSPDADLLDELSTLVSRSRDLARNHGVAAGAIQTLVDNVVGTGLRLSALPDYKALGKDKDWADSWSRKTEALWRSWAETTDCDAARNLTFNGLTTQMFRSGLINGEALALPLWLPQRHQTFATTIQVVEPDRLGNPNDRLNDRKIRGGIEVDVYGAPLAYWIAKTHPGDQLLGVAGLGQEFERIPARTRFGRQRVIHVHDKERTGQNRGKPIFTSIMPLFKMLDHYERSEMQAAVVNAMIAAFIETPLDGESISEMFGGSAEDYMAARNEWQVKLQGGAVIPIFPGDKVAPFTPSRPNSAYSSFVENILRHIGTGLNLPFELLMKDFSKTNYSSARAALMEAWRYFIGRRHWLATYWAKPVYELWLEEAINKGLIEAPGFYQNKALWCRCKWIGPGRGWIDPVKEAKASKIRLETGLSTLEDECATQGLDWEKVLEQRAREQAKMRELGLNTETSQYVSPTAEDSQ